MLNSLSSEMNYAVLQNNNYKIKASRLCLLKRIITVLLSDWLSLSCEMSDNYRHLWHHDGTFKYDCAA